MSPFRDQLRLWLQPKCQTTLTKRQEEKEKTLWEHYSAQSSTYNFSLSRKRSTVPYESPAASSSSDETPDLEDPEPRPRLCRAEEARILRHIDVLMGDVSVVLSELSGIDDSLDVLGITVSIASGIYRTAEVVAKSHLAESDAARDQQVDRVTQAIDHAVELALASAPQVASKVALITTQSIANTAQQAATPHSPDVGAGSEANRKLCEATANRIVIAAGSAYSKQCRNWLKKSSSTMDLRRRQSIASRKSRKSSQTTVGKMRFERFDFEREASAEGEATQWDRHTTRSFGIGYAF